jgi:hypothetical protein
LSYVHGLHLGREIELICHQPLDEPGSFTSKFTTGSWHEIRLRRTVWAPMFLRETMKARQARVSDASPRQAGPSGRVLAGSSRIVSSKALASGNSCGKGAAAIGSVEGKAMAATSAARRKSERIRFSNRFRWSVDFELPLTASIGFERTLLLASIPFSSHVP